MLSEHTKSYSVFLFVILSIALVFLNYIPKQNQFLLILTGFTLAFLPYFLLAKLSLKKYKLGWGLLAIVLARLFLLGAFPNLSDDIYRFIWDGYLLNHQVSVLEFTPTEALTKYGESMPYLNELFPGLNSKDYYTIYPPFSQWLFRLASCVENPYYSSLILKIVILSFDILGFLLLSNLFRQYNNSQQIPFIVYMNPLLITETIGQLHFESLMLNFMVLFIWLLYRHKYFFAGLSIATSIAIKLLPLMFLPAILFYLKKRVPQVKFLLGLSLMLMLSFAPFVLSLSSLNVLDSLGLYFRTFEFNASIYFILRSVGYLLTGYNQIAIIGPLMSGVALLLILGLAYKTKYQKLEDLLFVCFTSFIIYLLFTTTVHPWYLILPIAFGVMTHRWWILIWSFVVCLSYSQYVTPSAAPNFYLISLEYMIVLLAYLWGKK